MATLTGQTIASSYEQLLHVDRDGGGNSTTLVSIKDGDNGTTFGFQISTNALMMTSTNQLQFGDTGTYIYQSADGVLDLVSDTEIEINATTIDINGAVDISGNTTIGGDLTVNGTSTYINSTTLQIDDKLIELAHSPSGSEGADSAIDGGGIILKSSDSDKSILWENDDDSWHFNQGIVVGSNGSGYDVTFHSGTSGDSFVWDASEEKLTITGTNGQTALDIADGNLVVADNIDLEGDIDVNGTTNLDNTDIDGTLTQDAGNVVFNEAGADYDFRVESDGNENALRIDGAQGFVGIGASQPGYVNGNDHRGGNTQTSSGAGGLLHIEGLVPRIILDDTGDTPQYAIEAQDYFSILELADGSTSETTRFRISSAGNIGVGTSSPSKLLHLSGGEYPVLLENTGDQNSVIVQDADRSSADAYIGGFSAKWNNKRVAEVLAYSGADTTNKDDGYLSFATSSANNITERMRITSAGNVGIGTASPLKSNAFFGANATYLTISDSDGAVLELARGTNAESGIGGILFVNENNADASNIDADGKIVAGISVTAVTSDSNAHDDSGAVLRFLTKPEAGTLTDRMRITSGGNVGIGNSSLETWTGDYTALQIGGAASLAATTTQAAGDVSFLSHNCYYDTTNSRWEYMSTNADDEASQMYMQNGNVVFRVTSTAGADDAAVSWTTAMTIANDGNSTIGGNLTVDGASTDYDQLTIEGAAASGIRFKDSSGNTDGFVYASGTEIGFLDPGGDWMVAGSNDTHVRLLVTGATKLKVDANSRISLSNNDSGTSNTIFGKSAGASLDAGSNYNVFIGENVSDASMNDAVSNVGVGYSALSALTTGDHNVAIGSGAMATTTTNGKNIAIGYEAAANMAAGTDGCVAIGYQALDAAVDGAHYTIAIGQSALGALTSGEHNIGIGYKALEHTNTGTDNIAIGYQALGDKDHHSNCADSDMNIAIGTNAMGGAWESNKSEGNIAIGYHSMDAVMNGANDNVSVGHTALGALTDGDENVAIGYAALLACTSGLRNVMVGRSAGDELTTGDNNTGIGTYALHQLDANEDDNTAVGYNCGANVDGGSQNTLIGSGAATNVAAATNQIVIGYGATGGGNNVATIGNASLTDLYAGQSKQAKIHAANIELASSTANDPEIHIKNTSGGGDSGILKFTKDGGSAADDDTIASITVYADDDGGNSLNFGNIFWYSSDVSDGAEQSRANFTTRDGGAEKIPLRLSGGAMLNYISGTSYNAYTPRSTVNTDLVYESAVNGGIKIKFNANGDGYWDGAADNGSADYAEYFESTDGKAIPIGNTVVLENGKVRQAKDSETPIGIVRPHDGCAMVGNSAWSKWNNKYIRDDYGKYEYESYTKTRWFEEISKEEYEKKDKDDTGGVRGGSVRDILGGEKGTYYRQHEYYSDIIPSGLTVPDDAKILEDSSYQRHKINSDYNDSKEYKPREERDEWNIIGLLGQIPMTKGQPVASNWIKMKDVSDTVEMYFVK